MRTFQLRSNTQSLGPLPLPDGKVTVGSAPEASIRAASLPPIAFELTLQGKAATLVGRVLLSVGGLPFAPGLPRHLRAGEVVAVGDVLFALDVETQRRTDALRSPRAGKRLYPEHLERVFPKITWLTGADLGRTLFLHRDETMIGRSAKDGILLRDRYVSREHARIVLDADGARLVDLGSVNGLSVNGRRVFREARLEGGEILMVGATLLGFEAARLPVETPRFAPPFLATPPWERATDPGTPFIETPPGAPQ